ncbi:MAG: DHH family phosphoesterase [Candidatus Natronoplasma sp.]
MHDAIPIGEEEQTLLFHHWDTDGITSAALILQELNLQNVETFTPTIGNYLIDEEDRKKIEEIYPEQVIVVDMALPKDSIEFLKQFGKVCIFDHHLQEKHDVELHHNPIINGGSPKEFPSASWVISEFLNYTPDLLTILGAFGDREEKLKENETAMKTVNEVLTRLTSGFDDVLKCAERIDTLYKIGDREKITEMPWFLREIEKPEKILNRDDLEENERKLKEATESETEEPLKEIKEDVLYRKMTSPYNIISTVTRRLAWSREGKKVVVSNSEYQQNSCQIYIRGPLKNSETIIEKMKERGYSAGGKSDVVGMVVPEEHKEEVLEELFEML